MNDQEIKEMVETCNNAVERLVNKRISCSANYGLETDIEYASVWVHYYNPLAEDGRSCDHYEYPRDKYEIIKLGVGEVAPNGLQPIGIENGD